MEGKTPLSGQGSIDDWIFTGIPAAVYFLLQKFLVHPDERTMQLPHVPWLCRRAKVTCRVKYGWNSCWLFHSGTNADTNYERRLHSAAYQSKSKLQPVLTGDQCSCCNTVTSVVFCTCSSPDNPKHTQSLWGTCSMNVQFCGGGLITVVKMLFVHSSVNELKVAT